MAILGIITNKIPRDEVWSKKFRTDICDRGNKEMATKIKIELNQHIDRMTKPLK